MMTNDNLLLELTRSDLHWSKKDKSINNLTIEDFNVRMGLVAQYNIVRFVDDEDVKYFKHRWCELDKNGKIVG
jgi:hypothetical protein